MEKSVITIKLDGFSWGFSNYHEAVLAEKLWAVAKENGTAEINSFRHVFGGILRMMGATDSEWAKV